MFLLPYLQSEVLQEPLTRAWRREKKEVAAAVAELSLESKGNSIQPER